jgi:ABC-type oligopeptide transport system ATPase subunit
LKNPVLLSVRNYKQHFPINKSLTVHAVNGISFDLRKGEIFGLVGESGCGKSTVARAIMGIYTPTEGEICFKDFLISEKRSYREHKKDIQRNMQVIFQDSAAALNPRMKVADIIAEPLVINRVYPDRVRLRAEVDKLLTLVGLDTSYGNKFPAEISGGQRQRVCIARALAMNPEIIIADESVSALDVSVRAQIINLLLALQKEFRIAFLFISHDMAVIERVCHRVAVMYLGQIVELGSRRDVFENPLHPYTKRLMSAVPIPDPSRRTMSHTLLTGEIPSPVRSADYEPVVAPLKEVSPGHFVSEEQVANWF